MKSRLTSLLAAAAVVLCVAPAAFAQTIQFNRYFMCNGEREAVMSCRDDGDDSYCLVMYPDRPLRNGFEVQLTEKRGDLIKRIKSCVAPGATLASTGHPAPSAAPSAAAAAGPRPAPAGAPAAARPNAAPPPPDPSVAKARAAGVDMTVLGVPMGVGFTLPACQDTGMQSLTALFGMNAAPPAQKYPCATATNTQFASKQDGTLVEESVTFSQEEMPAWVPSPYVETALVKNGVLLGMYLNTTGQTGDATVSAQLIAKYGKPTRQQAVTFKNVYNYSAQFQQLYWTLPGLYVEYDPFVTDLNVGEVQIETESGHQIRVAETQAKAASGPKL